MSFVIGHRIPILADSELPEVVAVIPPKTEEFGPIPEAAELAHGIGGDGDLTAGAGEMLCGGHWF